MTLHRLTSSSRLLARKGAASPLGLRKVATNDVEDDLAIDTAEVPAAAEAPTQLTLVSDLEDEKSADTAGEPPPPASLLPFALHRKLREHGEAWELVSPGLLERISRAAGKDSPKEATARKETESEPPDTSVGSQKPDEPEEVLVPWLAIPTPESAAVQHKSGKTAAASTLEAILTIREAPAATDDMPEARPVAPVADPAWRVGVDTLPVTRDSGSTHWLGWGAAAALLVGAIAWWSFDSQAPEAPAVEAGSTNSEAVEPGAVQAETNPEPTSLAETPVPSADPAAQNSSAAAAPDEALSEPQTTEDPASISDSGAPSVDLVRIEANGDAVIAGRAAPNSELILLDNGAPIGTIKADAFGEWVFVPDEPLPQGGHEFGLVVKSVQGTVSIPAEPKQAPKAEDSSEAPAGPIPPSDAEPTRGDGAKPGREENSLLAPVPSRKPVAAGRESAVVAPIPERKPDFDAKPSSQSSSASPPSADFVVQLASVKTRDGARREWQKLQSRFPEVLSGMNLNLHETKLMRQGTVIRVRTGPFPGLSEAVDFCAQIRTSRQDCLVVRTSGGN